MVKTFDKDFAISKLKSVKLYLSNYSELVKFIQQIIDESEVKFENKSVSHCSHFVWYQQKPNRSPIYMLDFVGNSNYYSMSFRLKNFKTQKLEIHINQSNNITSQYEDIMTGHSFYIGRLNSEINFAL